MKALNDVDNIHKNICKDLKILTNTTHSLHFLDEYQNILRCQKSYIKILFPHPKKPKES